MASNTCHAMPPEIAQARPRQKVERKVSIRGVDSGVSASGEQERSDLVDDVAHEWRKQECLAGEARCDAGLLAQDDRDCAQQEKRRQRHPEPWKNRLDEDT